MNIEKHICDLLFHYECVIVPGFGGIITGHCPAMLQNEKHLFFPPSKFLAFNKNLNKQDGLLANYFSEKEKISYIEAVSQIDQFARLLNNKLDKGEKVHLANIGIFSTDKEKNILFSPEEQINYLTDSFGLSNFYSSPIKREKEILFTSKRSDGVVRRLLPTRVKTYHLAFAASVLLFASVWLPINTQTEAPHFDYSSLNTFSQIQKPINKAEALFSEYNPFAENQNQGLSKKLPIHLVAVADIDKSIGTADIKTENKPLREMLEAPAEIEKAEKIIETKIEETIITPNTKKQFYIIAGVFGKKENAEKMLRILHADGFTNALIVDKNKKGYYRVAFDEAYSEKDAAENSLREIKAGHKKSAWILKK